MNKKYRLLMLLALAFLFTLSACGGQATMEGGTTDPGQIEEGDTGDNGDVTLDQLSDTNKTPVADEGASTQEPYIVSLDDLPADLLGAFEYGYSTVHSEKPDLDEAERLEMELDLIRQWCDSFEIMIPDNLPDLYQSWHTQYEATLAALVESTAPSDNTGTQSGTVDSVIPPSSNSNSNSSGSQSSGGNTSKPSTGSSNSGSSSNGFTPPSDEELEAAFGEPPLEGSGNVDGSGTYVPDLEDRLDGTQGSISY